MQSKILDAEESNRKIIERYNELKAKYKQVKKELKIARNLISVEPSDQSSAPEFIQVTVKQEEKKAMIQKAVIQEAVMQEAVMQEKPKQDQERPQEQQQEEEPEQEPEEEPQEQRPTRRVCVTM